MRPHTKDSLSRDVLDLFSYVNRHRHNQFVLLVFLMLASSISEIASIGAIFPFLEALGSPQSLMNDSRWQPLLTTLNIDSPSSLVKALGAIFIATILIANGLRLITLNAQLKFAASIGSDISCRMYDTTLQQPYSFHIQNNSSNLMQTIIEDSNLLTFNVLMPMLSLITDSLIVIGLVAALITVSGKISIGAALILGLAYASLYQFRRNKLRKNSKIITCSGQNRIKAVQEGIAGIKDVLIVNGQSFFLQSYREADASLREAHAENALIAQLPRYIVEAIAMSCIALLSLALESQGNFSQVTPVIGSLTLGAKRLLPSLQAVFASLALIQGARESLARVVDVLRRSRSTQAYLSVGELPFRDTIKLENIWYRYGDSSDWIIKGLCLEIPYGSTIGLVGTTGSGKSTTVDILLGLLQPQEGVILVDQVPIKQENILQWQNLVTHVPQNIFLMEATIAENIAFASSKQDICPKRLSESTHLARLDSLIRSLPMGYNTYVGENGVRLSGGEKQRIGIARALYRNASVIVFDEATSALDRETEDEVMAAINGLKNRVTMIVITHRLNTLSVCDQTFSLSEGVATQTTFETSALR